MARTHYQRAVGSLSERGAERTSRIELLLADERPGSHGGGVARTVLEVSRELAERGHVIDFVYAQRGDFLATYAGFCRTIEWTPNLRLDRQTPVSSSLGVLRGVRRSLRKRHDIVYLHYPSHDVFGTAVGFAQRAAVVCHLHFAPPPQFGWSNILTTPGISRYIAVSRHVKRSWVSAGLKADWVDVVHNGVNPARYAPGDPDEIQRTRVELGVGPEQTLVVFAGRLHPSKGAHVLADAMVRVARPDWRLVVAGAVDPRPSVEAGRAYAESVVRRSPAGTVLAGLLVDVVPLYQAADVVVVPTIGDEGFPRVIIEAMSCGVPVVGSRVGGIPEALTGQLARFLFESGDAVALASLLEQVCAWRTQEPGLGAVCREHVRRSFTSGHTVDAIEAALRSAVCTNRIRGVSASRRRLLRWNRVGHETRQRSGA
ncbi:MAG: glycosyltransferase family 4 protein [Chloroflexi bacterium]|nr:MAG: glycosyltransferase family 4 protein [Chloroflexota bacterium]